MSITIEDLAAKNPYVSACVKANQTEGLKTKLTPEQIQRAKIIGIAWFIFREQGLFWSLAFSPRKFIKLAIVATVLGMTAGGLLELVKPSELPPSKEWSLWFEREAALNQPYNNFRKFLEANGTLLHVALSSILEREFRCINALRLLFYAHYLGRQIIHRGRN